MQIKDSEHFHSVYGANDNCVAKGVDAMHAVLENAQRLVAESKFESKMFDPDPAADAVLRNAERLLLDAAILAEHGSYQSALSLAALSFEESGKSCIVRWRRAGLLNRNIENEIKVGHSSKQRVFAAYIGAQALCDFSKKHTDPISSFRELGKMAMFLIHDADSLKYLLSEILFLLSQFNDKLRFSGFYQDLDQELNANDQSGADFKVLYEQMHDRPCKSLVMARADPATQVLIASFYEYGRMQLLDRNDRKEKLEKFLDAVERLRQIASESHEKNSTGSNGGHKSGTNTEI
jgi:AbiV family abortive infection protein